MNILQEVTISTKNILLVDDELNVCEIVKLCLTDLGGWNVVTADSPFTALQRAEIERFDAIVLDLSTRGSFIFLKQLRNNPRTHTIPVVLLSATARWLDPEFLQQYQIAGVILKPFNPITIPVQMAQIIGWDYLPSSDYGVAEMQTELIAV